MTCIVFLLLSDALELNDRDWPAPRESPIGCFLSKLTHMRFRLRAALPMPCNGTWSRVPWTAILVLVTGLIGATAQDSNANHPERTQAKLNKFAWRLLLNLSQEKPQATNIVVCPASVQFALGMAGCGAVGETANAISEVLGGSDGGPERLFDDLAHLQRRLQAVEPPSSIKIANAMWVDLGVQLKSEFAQKVKESFGGEVFVKSFEGVGIIAAINKWAADRTEGKIRDLILKPPQPPLCLVNTVYLAAPWERPFEPKLTSPQQFHLEFGTSVEVDMMRKRGGFLFRRQNSYEVICLPFKGGRLCLVLMLPTGGHPNEVIGELIKSESEFWNSYQRVFCNLTMPRFRAVYRTEMQLVLSKMGMAPAFDPKTADFSRMIERPFPLYIQSVIQKNFLQIDEFGSEAAGATALIMPRAMMPEEVGLDVTFDRPFIFALTDQETKSILFTGIIANPADRPP
jgi:serine protease inhibitor